MLYPIRAQLPSPETIGIGTPKSESLRVYTTRLAKMNGVQAEILVREFLLADIECKDLRPWLTGSGERMLTLVRAIEKSTLRNDIRYLTFLPFRPLIGERLFIARKRKWCPVCLEEMKERGSPIYELLAWELEFVNCCLVHKLLLESECPKCHREAGTVLYTAVSGYCEYCGHWLGHHQARRQPCSDYDLWVSEAVGELISVSPVVKPDSLPERFSAALERSTEILAQGNIYTLGAQYFGDKDYFSLLFRRVNYVPLLRLLKIAYRLGISVRAILSGAEFVPVPRGDRTNSNHFKRRKRNLEDLMSEAYINGPAVSTLELAQSLGYGSSQPLWHADPDLARKISEKHRKSGRPKRKRKWDPSQAKSLLEENLRRECPLSVATIAKSLSVNPSQLYSFGDLCTRTTKKIRQFQQEIVVAAVRRALKDDSPVSAREVARSLGHPSNRLLYKFAPELTKQLIFRKKHLHEAWKITLKKTKNLYPPSQQTEVAKRCGTSLETLKKYYPEEMKEIARRRARYEAEKRNAQARGLIGEVRRIVRELDREGTPITLGVVCRRTKRHKNPWDFEKIRTILNEIMLRRRRIPYTAAENRKRAA